MKKLRRSSVSEWNKLLEIKRHFYGFMRNVWSFTFHISCNKKKANNNNKSDLTSLNDTSTQLKKRETNVKIFYPLNAPMYIYHKNLCHKTLRARKNKVILAKCVVCDKDARFTSSRWSFCILFFNTQSSQALTSSCLIKMHCNVYEKKSAEQWAFLENLS
jgi:hypothetical protein